MSPLTHGSVSLREFYVEGKVARDWNRAYDLPLSRHAFRPIAVAKGETVSVGWVNPRQILDADVAIEKLRVGPAILLALRQERITLNARLFRARRDLAVAEAAAKAGKSRLSKNERQAVEERVRLDMLRGQSPSTQIIEALWRPDEAVAYVAASSESAALVFSEVFASTFALTLIPAVAGVRAMRWAEQHGLDDRLEQLAPIAFSARPVGPDDLADADNEEDNDGST